MVKWRVRKYVWSDYKGGVGYGKRTVVEEVIEAHHVIMVDSSLHFFYNYDTQGNPNTAAIRFKGEWFAVDRINEQQEATIEATMRQIENWRVSHAEAAQPELA